MKSFCKFLLRFLLVILILVVLVCVGLLVWYLVTLQTAEDYLPGKFLFYVKIDSLKQVYDNVLDLKAADVLFSQPEFIAVRRALLEFKSNDISRHPLLKALLEMRASIAVHEDRSVSLVLEPGLLSLGTRNFGLISAFLKVENLNITATQKGEATIYGIGFGAGARPDFYFSAAHNLLFVSDKPANIESLHRNKAAGTNLRYNESLSQVQGKLGEKGMLELYVNTPTLVNLVFKDLADARAILSGINFSDLSLLSFNVTNDELALGVYSSFTPVAEAITSFLDYQPRTLGSLAYPTADASVFTALNVKSFRDLFNLRLLVNNGELEGTLTQVDGLSRSLFDLSIDDLLFNWMGEEVGAFLTAGSPQPVVFVGIRDRAKLETVFQKLGASLLLDRDSSLVFNEVRLSRIRFPDLVKGIVNLFVADFDMPYYYQTDDFLFFCMDPEVLADAVNGYRAGRVLVRNEVFRATTDAYPKNANLFFYYDLTRSRPPFFPQGSLPERLFRLYESGLISVYLGPRELKVFVSARGVAGNKTVPFPGFPRPLPNGTRSDVLIEDLYGSAVGELVYIDNDNQLVIQDFLGDGRVTAPLEPQSVIAHIDAAKPDGNALFTYAPSGVLGRYDRLAQPAAPFPMTTAVRNSFAPVDMGRELLFFSHADRAFFLLPKAGGREQKIDFHIDNPVLAPPSARDGVIAFYPKSFEGAVFLITREGELVNGWSQNGGGISLSGPRIIKNPDGPLRVVFLTQAGILNLWDKSGRQLPGFPVSAAGTYFSAPVPVSRAGASPALALLSDHGLCLLVSQTGEIIKEKRYPEAGGRNADLLAFDIDHDGTDEIFLYGNGNFVIGLDRHLELLPGFPVKGGRRPAFTDINLDGRRELVTAGFDNQLHAYELGL